MEITFDAAPPLPADWPAAWLQPESSAALIRFTDSRYEAERTMAEIRRRFPDARNVTATPLPLRTIFVTVAKAAKRAAAA